VGDRRYVAVSGPPGSGKSTLAPMVADGLVLPLLAKDTIKEALLPATPAAGVEASRRAGQAAMEVLFALAADSPTGAVLEANFHRTLAAPSILGLPGRTLEVFCRCDREVARRRYRARAGGRDPGHFDAARSDEEIWHDEVNRPVVGGWPVVEVDTNGPVALAELLGRLADLWRGTGAGPPGQGRAETFSLPYRCVWPAELDLMARIADRRLRVGWGGRRHEPFTSESTSHVSVWERPGR
jgi:predicted kinase